MFGATGVGGTAGKATAGFVGVAADIAKDECKNSKVRTLELLPYSLLNRRTCLYLHSKEICAYKNEHVLNNSSFLAIITKHVLVCWFVISTCKRVSWIRIKPAPDKRPVLTSELILIRSEYGIIRHTLIVLC